MAMAGAVGETCGSATVKVGAGGWGAKSREGTKEKEAEDLGGVGRGALAVEAAAS